jgi:hypothetical protein
MLTSATLPPPPPHHHHHTHTHLLLLLPSESRYDLFNLHFRKFSDTVGDTVEVTYHTNVAVGAHSRRCKVSQGFQCIVHLTLDELRLAPAPFLNRFEKFRLTHGDILQHHLHEKDAPGKLLRELPLLLELLREQGPGCLAAHAQRFVLQVGERGFYGFAEHQTIESALDRLLETWITPRDAASTIVEQCQRSEFEASVRSDLEGDASALDLWDGIDRSVDGMLDLLLGAVDSGAAKIKVARVVLGHVIVHEVVQRLLDVAIPEQIFRNPRAVPRGLLQEYVVPLPPFAEYYSAPLCSIAFYSV